MGLYRKIAVALSLLPIACATTYANVLLEETKLVARTPEHALIAPASRTFTVTTAGRYRATLSDIGFPNPATSMDVIVMQGVRTVLRMTREGSAEFDAVPGEYTVRVLGKGTGAGTLGVSVDRNGGVAVLNFQAGFVGVPVVVDPNRSAFAASFAVTQAGTYQVSVVDRAFPAALASVDMLVVARDGTPVARVCIPANPPICAGSTTGVGLSAGDYDLFINAAATALSQAGLLSVHVGNGLASPPYAVTHPIGKLRAHAALELSAAGQYDLRISDFQFPTALANVSAAIAQGSELLTTGSGSTTQTFVGAQGSAALYAVAGATNTSSVGIFGLRVTNGSQTVYDDVRAITGSTFAPETNANARAYAFAATLPAAGSYRIDSYDLAFPAAIPTLQILAAQNGASLGTAGTAGRLDIVADAGPLVVVAIANMVSSSGTGLFSTTIAANPSGQQIFAATQGVGDLFHTQTIALSKSGKFDIDVVDAGFPAAFADLAVTLTRGTAIVGQIFGGGSFSFDGTPGNYSLNLIARSAATQNYGLYGVKLEDRPTPPVVTLSASPTALAAGGTTTLTWDAKDATSCTASGDWNGARDTSGSASGVGPFSKDSTLTLTCEGPGGSSSAAASVTVAGQTTTDGKGAFGLEILVALTLLAMRRRSS